MPAPVELASAAAYASDGIAKFAEVDKNKWRGITTGTADPDELGAFLEDILNSNEEFKKALRIVAGAYGAEFAKHVADAETEWEVVCIAHAKNYDMNWVRHVMQGKKAARK